MADQQTTVLASRRMVLGGGAAPLDASGPRDPQPLIVAPACVELEPPFISRVERLTEQGYAARMQELARAPGTVAHDYGDMLLSPAFVNAHTHLALGFLRGADLRAASRGNMVEDFFFTIEGRMTPDDVRAFVRMGAYESLLAGVGLVWDHYYAGDHVAAGVADVGLAAVVAPTLQDLSGPGAEAWEAQLDATARIDGDTALAARGIFAAVGPHATDTVSAELFGRALDLAEQRELPLHMHLAQSPEEHRRAFERLGLSPVGLLAAAGVLDRAPATALAHGIYLSGADLARLADRRHRLIHCPFSQLVFGFPAPADAWTRRGLSWAVATDCASNNDSMDVQKELRWVAGLRNSAAPYSAEYRRFVERGAPGDAAASWRVRSESFAALASLGEPAVLLDKVWALPGAIHPKMKAGIVAEGALANFAVWDTDHPALWPALDPLAALAMADPAQALWSLWVAGRRLGDDGDVHRSIARSDEYREARTEARARLDRVLG